MEQTLVYSLKKTAGHLLTQCQATGFIDFFFSSLSYLHKRQIILDIFF